jgi:hypothetical protein
MDDGCTEPFFSIEGLTGWEGSGNACVKAWDSGRGDKGGVG